MQPGEPSRTALGAAAHRAVHQVLERGRIFADLLAPHKRKLVPFQLVPTNPYENTLSLCASHAWTVIWPKWLERH